VLKPQPKVDSYPHSCSRLTSEPGIPPNPVPGGRRTQVLDRQDAPRDREIDCSLEDGAQLQHQLGDPLIGRFFSRYRNKCIAVRRFAQRSQLHDVHPSAWIVDRLDLERGQNSCPGRDCQNRADRRRGCADECTGYVAIGGRDLCTV